jgi:hypothetical protein
MSQQMWHYENISLSTVLHAENIEMHTPKFCSPSLTIVTLKLSSGTESSKYSVNTLYKTLLSSLEL